jgi:hypothetical protein
MEVTSNGAFAMDRKVCGPGNSKMQAVSTGQSGFARAPAALGTVFHFGPVFFPFFSPTHWPTATGTGFFGKKGFISGENIFHPGPGLQDCESRFAKSQTAWRKLCF